MTVMLSMNIERTADMSMKVTNIGTVLHFTRKAIFMQSHLKNPDSAIPSTIIIIPARKTIVAQFMPRLSDSVT